MSKVDFVQRVMDSLNFEVPVSAAEWVAHPVLENYHRHSDWSNGCVTDSVESQENYAERTLEFGGKCLFTTEHGTQGDAFGTYDICERTGLKYRHGAEAYWTYDRTQKDRFNKHIVLIARNDEGRREINYALSMANIDGYYYQPRVDLELLLEMHPENVIITSACVAGWRENSMKDPEKLKTEIDKFRQFELNSSLKELAVINMVQTYDELEPEMFWKRLALHFGDSFFLEVQAHKAPVQKELNRRIQLLARDWHVQLIAGLDSHYVLEENKDRRLQYQKDKNINYDHEEDDSFYMDYPDVEELYRRFKEQDVLTDEEIIQAILNTLIFQSSYCDDIVLDKSFKIPNLYKNLTYEQRTDKLVNLLRKEYVKQGDLERNKAKGINQQVGEGIKWEINQFVESDTVDYPLFSTELVSRAVNKFNGILTTTSRGSAASFITNKLLGFTTVDRYNAEIPIHPERFLTKDRILAGSLPDIDFNTSAQEPFIQAARDLLGEHGAYPLLTLQKLKTKNAWKMYARIHGVDPQVANDISKEIDKYIKALSFAEDDEKDQILIEDFIEEKYLDLYKQSIDYQGITDGFGTHACGVLCVDGDIRREIGLVSAKSEAKKSRNLVAAIEGKWLDPYGYLKQDFLIVDTVSLTYKLFQSIGKPVPTFEELKELVKDDPATWDIYAKGITCCVNQVEKQETTSKVMAYKPKSIGELSAFVAAIRPGFKSLVGTFIARRPYSTGEPEIDKLLEESQHFLLYQESIMAVLSFLGIEMAETYQIIKSISKKKLKGKKKDDLLEKLKKGWLERFGNLDNFSKVWTVIEDAAAYAFNSPHSYSMAGDSLYSAYFKAHYPEKFYKVAIDHYQNKKNKDKMQSLTTEAIEFFGYKMGSYEYGADNRSTNINDETKTIYPPLTNIKGFGTDIVEVLYQIPAAFEDYCIKSNKDFTSFWELLKFMELGRFRKINTSLMDILIKLDYFHQFGGIKKLLGTKKYFDYYKKIGTGVFLKSIEAMNLNPEIAKKYGDLSKTKINNFDKDGFFEEVLRDLPETETTNIERIQYQIEIFGHSNIVDESIVPPHAFITDIEEKNKFGILTIYNPRTGNQSGIKYWLSQLENYPVGSGSFVKVKVTRKPKRRWNGEYKDKNKTKKVFVDVEGEYEYWLDSIGLC